VTKKHQTSLALIAIVLATAMIAGTLASSTDNLAFAGGNHGKKAHFSHNDNHGKKATVGQSVSEACSQDQNAPVTTAGGISPPILSGINLGLCVNANLGGNVGNAGSNNQ
ncbi:MAG TPA: hypothetical protein VGC75_04285, partial [Candidatus Nitrosocosmicus sp.]